MELGYGFDATSSDQAGSFLAPFLAGSWLLISMQARPFDIGVLFYIHSKLMSPSKGHISYAAPAHHIRTCLQPDATLSKATIG